MQIGQLARLTDATPRAIRRYEALGLVTPTRTGSGYRDYDEHDVRTVREIRALNRLGIPVEETRTFLDCLADGGDHVDDCPASLAEYQRAIDALTVRIADLTERRDALRRRLRAAAYRHSESAPPAPGLTVLPPDLPVPVDDGAASHLTGQTLPSLAFDSTDGTVVDLSRLGSQRVVLYLYPLTGRPDADLPVGWNSIPGARGCTAQACDFRDHHQDLRAAGVQCVYGLSSQPSTYQAEVVDRLRLPFAMLSDTGLRLAATLAAPTFEVDGTTLYKRMTLIVREQTIEHVFYPVFPPDQHAAEVLRWLQRNPE
ncbi:redoxin family protein [Nocardia nova]|uniref:MerR family transcriptional regulator n=1 Tax=Nocardia nova TaxID=37330 RepID=UPI001C47C7A1|nr:MerR family transcriptional regulator [Nocardia nova]MBV7708152.1 redoxin family protein [Nocardia nova]